jgi:hypothetical protein
MPRVSKAVQEWNLSRRMPGTAELLDYALQDRNCIPFSSECNSRNVLGDHLGPEGNEFSSAGSDLGIPLVLVLIMLGM